MKKILYATALAITLLGPAVALAAGGSLYIRPDSGVYRVGDLIELQIFADTDGHPVNAAEAELAYNPGDFAVEKISTDGSILNSWSTAPSYDGAAGTIQFSGWAQAPYTGQNGLLIAVTLRALRVTQSRLLFNSGAMLATDLKSSNIINEMQSASFSISAAQIVPPPPAVSQEVAPEQTQTAEQIDQTSASVPVIVPESQAASLLSSGIELAPVLVIFFGLLILIAFCIAYILHRRGVR